MKYKILFLVLMASSVSKAQYFMNSNSELIYELYRKSDKVGEYRVFVVIDEETTFYSDSLTIKKLHGLPNSSKMKIADQWRLHGKRIEVERAPYISYSPRFPSNMNDINLQKIDQSFDWENSPWIGVKHLWKDPEHPF